MKLSLTLFFILLSLSLSAQINPENILGSWVKTKVTHQDGSEVPDNIDVKYYYLKYTFSRGHKLNIAFSYDGYGNAITFSIENDQLLIHSTSSIDNYLKIEKLTSNELVLTQEDEHGLKDPKGLKYFFAPEPIVQKNIVLTPADILHATAGDTVYKRNSKIYPIYKGKQNFDNYLVSAIGEDLSMSGRNGHILASFIVSKLGVADSLKILEGISPDYDKLFAKIFNKEKKNWKPAMLNGKPVSVQRTAYISYVAMSEIQSSDEYSEQANEAYQKSDYKQALYFYDRALEIMPRNIINLYKRAICNINLGKHADACIDLQKLKALGNCNADELIAKYCR